jgi:hypothetical protein
VNFRKFSTLAQNKILPKVFVCIHSKTLHSTFQLKSF